MRIESLIGKFVSEAARYGVEQLMSQNGPARICTLCRTDELGPFSLTLPCCRRVLCTRCAAESCLHRWDRRCVIRCDDCRTHTFELG